MQVKHVGIITNSATPQGSVNDDHAQDLADALTELDYTPAFYNVEQPENVIRLMKDRKTGKLDLAINNSSGKRGGDGSVEGLFEMLDIPYVGSDVLATAVAFDKKTTKQMVATEGIRIIRGDDFTNQQYQTKQDWVLDEIEFGLKFPVVVKASQSSDSIGVSLVRSMEELTPALDLAFQQDDVVIVEDFVKRHAEVTCLVIGNGADAETLLPVERVFEGDILYARDITERTYRIPTHLEPAILDVIQKQSIICHNALGCADYSRTDYIITRQGKIFFLELNAHAGMGKIGPTTFGAQETYNWTHSELIGRLVNEAIARYKQSGK